MYSLLEGNYQDEGTKNYRSYGICLRSDAGEFQIPDVSLERELVWEAVELFNKYQLSHLHFREATEDFLVGKYQL